MPLTEFGQRCNQHDEQRTSLSLKNNLVVLCCKMRKDEQCTFTCVDRVKERPKIKTETHQPRVYYLNIVAHRAEFPGKMSFFPFFLFFSFLRSKCFRFRAVDIIII